MSEEVKEEVPKASSKGANTGMAIVAYFIFFIPLLTDAKKDAFVMFHVKQSLVLWLAAVAVSVVGSIIPFIGWFLILPFGSLLVFILWVIGLMNAIQGKQKAVPLVGQFGEKFNF